MTNMMLENMMIDPMELTEVNGGAKVKCYRNLRTISLATLRSGGRQSSGKIAMLSGGTKVLGSDTVRKDKIYTYRFCYVPSLKKSGWIADSLLR